MGMKMDESHSLNHLLSAPEAPAFKPGEEGAVLYFLWFCRSCGYSSRNQYPSGLF
ncbi:hypothetical protein KKC1_30070 [Calderihabitans maritimus]|uniref:Uncharacterized protein n=1 Tax=Calderihabitans maritimus TaxID=1246530 RepID=A0A1Z5HWH3_9FIRM|nr:hypothetical protein KKC1_30070 [Calderihabitans maritimus]